MDGPHDLGGKDGFGPVDPNTPPFAEDWEARQWALSKNVPMEDGTIDWWRHGIENMEPAVYATVPYFVKWNLNELAHRIDQGMFTLEETIAGAANDKAPAAAVKSVDDLLVQLQANATNFARHTDEPALFAISQEVQTTRTPVPGHTRLPAYARGARGTVIAHHGAHLLPDAGAKGVHLAQHLYTVEFPAVELWGDSASARDTVCLDLWESYLAPA